jgi:hypothetical protein
LFNTVHKFEGMPGVKKALRGTLVRSVSAADRDLRSWRIVSTANDFGAANLYIDDNGVFRGEFFRNRIPYDSHEFKTKKSALKWFGKAIVRTKNPAY